MALYTMELSSIVESIVMQQTGKTKYDFKTHDEMIDIASPFIFEDYPLFDESHRLELNRKIISEYYFREICTTPFGRWKFMLNKDLKLKMYEYNELYKNVALKYDLFDNVDLTETLDRDLSGSQNHTNSRTATESDDISENKVREMKDDLSSEQSSDNTVNSNTHKVFDDTPVGMLGTANYATDVNKTDVKDTEKGSQKGSQKQNTNLTDVNNTEKYNEVVSNSENVSSTANSEDYVKVLKGKNSARSNTDLILEARRAIVNIDEKIVQMLSRNFSGYFN